MTELEWFNKPIQKSRDLILKEAFKLFLQKNVEKVTVPELERVTKLQRGAIFYHFKDKERIFSEVIETYFFSRLNIFYPIKPDEIHSLKEYWGKKNEHLLMIESWFNQEEIPTNPPTAFFHIAEQANLYMPTFKEKMLNWIDCDKKYWEQVAHKDLIPHNSLMNFAVDYSLFRSIYVEQYYTACYSKKLHLIEYPYFLESLFYNVAKK